MASLDNRTAVTFNATSNLLSPQPAAHLPYRAALLSIYSVVLLGGILGIALMVRVLQTNTRSLTTIGMKNLIFAHFLFLLSVPFRISYHATGSWGQGEGLCSAVSGMIHVHMYMSFVFYLVILSVRLLSFYRGVERVEFRRRQHALLASLCVWAAVAVAVPCVIHCCYGRKETIPSAVREDAGAGPPPAAAVDRPHCFEFGVHIERQRGTKALNYVASVAIIAVACVLTALQANVLVALCRKYGRGWRAQQEFWAQLTSLCVALIMAVCFVPYHTFRLYYLERVHHLQHVNEVCLSLTTLCCLDMLILSGRGCCSLC